MRVLLAPMEGVLDSLVRELLTEVNDYDHCITEFVRVVDQLLPAKSFYRICPELHHQSRTPPARWFAYNCWGNTPSGWRKTRLVRWS
jgi:tRNA-dihydrouridine synthase C